MRQTKIPTLKEANDEIRGTIMRAFTRGFDNFVAKPIRFKERAMQDGGSSHPTEKEATEKKPPPQKPKAVKVGGIDEASLLRRLDKAGHTIEYFEEPTYATKWRVETDDWKVFCPREPGNMIIVKGAGREDFLAWFHAEKEPVTQAPALSLPTIEAHIGVDEAGKGDYFGPLTIAAVYVTPESAVELIRWGVRDSKSLSDTSIAELALKIRERCPNVDCVVMPPEYNTAYQQHRNLNRLLAEAHARVIKELVEETGCQDVVDDQFAAPHILEEALAEQEITVELEQRTGGESDVAVAAASILARESFVAAIEDFRAKTEMVIPLGSSSPEVVRVGRAIVQRWGPKALERIAKMHFKTTGKILGNR